MSILTATIFILIFLSNKKKQNIFVGLMNQTPTSNTTPFIHLVGLKQKKGTVSFFSYIRIKPPPKKRCNFPPERIKPLAPKGDGSSPMKSSLLVIDCINELCHDIEQ